MIKPFKIFLLLLLIIVLLCIPSLFFPTNGIMIGNLKFQYPSIHSFFGILNNEATTHELRPEIAYLDKLLESDSSLFTFKKNVPVSLVVDSSKFASDSTKVVDTSSTTEINVEWLRSHLVRLEFPDSSKVSLVSFFNSLKSGEPNRTLIRVMHYGDSQIEGDRITSYLRAKLQRQYGGRGVGLIHAVPASYQPTAIRQSASSNWEKVTLADHDKESSGINRYGAIGGYSTFKPTNDLFSKSSDEGWIQIQRIGDLNFTARGFTRLKVFYGYNSEPFLVELNTNNKVVEADLLPTTSKLSQISWGVEEKINTFELKFKGGSSPIIFGLSLETDRGIIVDNIPIRGSSGTDFTKTDMLFMKDMFKMLNARLIILQFGVNAVPKPLDNYNYYEILLYKQIKAIQEAKPDASIVVIGVSDVARKEGSEFVSYPNVELIRDAQKKAAHRAGVPFWDCFRAMGGKNSMAAWAFAKPPLANKDFIHFTIRGSNVVAELFYTALMAEYETYLAKFERNEKNSGKSNVNKTTSANR